MSSSKSQKIFSNLDLVEACDNLPYDATATSEYYTLYLPNDNSPHGYITPTNISLLPWHASPAFKIDHESRQVSLTLPSSASDDTTADTAGAACTAAFSAVVDAAIDNDTFRLLSGQHSELYRIIGAKYAVAVERFAAPLFGITTRGVHLTIFSYLNPSHTSGTSSSGRQNRLKDMRIWVPRRSLTLFTHPGKLDSSVAGGVPAHETPLETLVHEADEEASLPPELIKGRVRSGGALTYMHVAEPVESSHTASTAAITGDGRGLREGYVCGDCIYVYDLELTAHEAETVKLVPKDGEVKEFLLMSVDEVKEAMSKGEFKPNSALVMLDFFIRHGILTPEDEPAYVDIMARLHRRMPFPLTDHGCSYPAPS